MLWKTLYQATVLCVAVFSHCGGAASAASTSPPTLDAVFQRLGYSEADKQAALQGEIVSTDLTRTRDDQIIAAVALPINASLADLAAPLKDGSNIPFDAATLAWGQISPAGADDLMGVAYSDSETSEVRKLLGVRTDGTFNFSSDEIAFLQETLKGLDVETPETAELAAAAYRQVLAERTEAYTQNGLDAVATYDHGDLKLQPAKELRAVEEQADDFLSAFFPDFWASLRRYPGNQSPGISSKIYWVKRTVEGRPAFILIHQMVEASDDFVLTSQRQFYVGHTYESLQMLGLALPTQQGCVVFSVTSVFTDQITGFFSGVAQSVGQSRTKDSMAEHFEKVRQKIE